LAINEFDFPFLKFDIIPKEGAIISRLHGFEAVSIVKFNPNLVKVSDLTLLVTHTKMYTRVHIWLRIGDGVGGLTIVAQHQRIYIFCLISSNLLNIEIFEEVDLIPKVRDLWLSIATISSSP
jgi:hypothetical protein